MAKPLRHPRLIEHPLPPPLPKTRFSHNPAKGSLTTETDRLYLWTLVLALEYEDTYTFTPSLPSQDETGFMKLLREAVFVNSCVTPEQAAAEIATREAQLHADTAVAHKTEAGTSEGRGEAQGRGGEGEGGGGGGGVGGENEEGGEGGGGGDTGLYLSDGCRGELETDGEGSVSRSETGGPIRGGSGSGDQAYRNEGLRSSGADKLGSGMLRSSTGDAIAADRTDSSGAVLAERVRANSGGGSGDIETGAGRGVL